MVSAPMASSPALRRATRSAAPSRASPALCGEPLLAPRRPARAVAARSAAPAVFAAAVPALPTFSLPSLPFANPFDTRKTVIITGASSGLGRTTTEVLAKSGKWHVVMAVRDPVKARIVAAEDGLPKDSFSVLSCDLDSLSKTAAFADAFLKTGRRLDVLVCNAAVYLPNQQAPTWTADGYEESFGVNHLAHHLLVRKLLPTLARTRGSRCVIVGSITGNSNTVGGGAVLPLADLGGLGGLEAGAKRVAMLGSVKEPFNGAKAYKDAKLANMMTVLELHRRYNASTGVIFTSMYPGCIAETALFRQKRGWFRWLFPIFMKYVTGGYVSQEEAGERLAATVADAATGKSGVYWSWNGGARTVGWLDVRKNVVRGAGGAGGELFENEPSDLVRDPVKAKKLFDLCDGLVAPFVELKSQPPAATSAFALA